MNTKKIIIILGSIVLFLILIFVLMNLLPKNQPPTPPSPTEVTNPGQPTGVIVPTRDIAQGGFDIVSIDPQDMATNIPLDQIITITFNREYQDSEITFSISPATPYMIHKEGNKLTIFPQSTWETGTPYGYSVNFADDAEKVRLYRFTTTGPTPEFLPDTQPEGAYDAEEKKLRENYTDMYVNNNMPYETDTFSAVSEYNPNPPEHFFFIVTSKTPDKNLARSDFITWLKSIQLTDEQIGKLDIQYK